MALDARRPSDRRSARAPSWDRPRRTASCSSSRGTPPATAALIPSIAMSYPPSRHTEKSWCSRCPSRCTENDRYLLGLEQMKLFFQKQRVRAQIDVLLARDQTGDDLVDPRMQQRLAAGNRDHRRARTPPPRGSTPPASAPLQNVRRVLDFAAAGARQVAAEQRLQHSTSGKRFRPFIFCFRT